MVDEVKSLSEVQEERGILNETVDKLDYIGKQLQIERFDPMPEESTVACMVTAVDVETGEMIMFSGGKPMRRILEKVADALPLTAHIKGVKTSSGNTTYILE